MKIAVIAILTLSMGAALIGCSGSSEPAAETPPAPKPTPAGASGTPAARSMPPAPTLNHPPQ